MSSRLFDKIGYNFIEGKGLLIVLVVLFSSVSFILGFFAGKKVSTPAVMQAKKVDSANMPAKVDKPAVTAPPQPPLLQRAELIQTDSTPKPSEQPEPVKKTTVEIVNTNIKTDPIRPLTPPPDQTQSKPVAATPTKPQPVDSPKPTPSADIKTKQKKSAKQIPDTKPDTPPPAAETAKPNPAPKDVLTPVTPPQQGASQGTPQASKTTAKLQKQPKENPPSNSGEKYYIQIGAFRNFSDAMKLQEDLKSKGFDCNILKNPVNGDLTLYKVRIGGNYSKSEASQTMTSLNKKGFRGFIKETSR